MSALRRHPWSFRVLFAREAPAPPKVDWTVESDRTLDVVDYMTDADREADGWAMLASYGL